MEQSGHDPSNFIEEPRSAMKNRRIVVSWASFVPFSAPQDYNPRALELHQAGRATLPAKRRAATIYSSHFKYT
jgi:hypothetical protein